MAFTELATGSTRCVCVASVLFSYPGDNALEVREYRQVSLGSLPCLPSRTLHGVQPCCIAGPAYAVLTHVGRRGHVNVTLPALPLPLLTTTGPYGLWTPQVSRCIAPREAREALVLPMETRDS